MVCMKLKQNKVLIERQMKLTQILDMKLYSDAKWCSFRKLFVNFGNNE